MRGGRKQAAVILGWCFLSLDESWAVLAGRGQQEGSSNDGRKDLTRAAHPQEAQSSQAVPGGTVAVIPNLLSQAGCVQHVYVST